jgi:hypothetical protein
LANVEIQLPHGRAHAGRATIVDGNWNSHRAERKELSGETEYRHRAQSFIRREFFTEAMYGKYNTCGQLQFLC